MYFFIVALDAGATSSASRYKRRRQRPRYVCIYDTASARPREGRYIIGRYIGGMECD